MLFTLKSFTLYLAVLLTGLSAGLFFAWAVSVIPGTQRISDAGYLESMQSINRAILNPAFYLIFLGPIVTLGLSTFQHRSGSPSFWLLLVATALYLVGTFGITVFGNVPLNDQLELVDLSRLTTEESNSFRLSYEQDWNRLHRLRTLAAVTAFGAVLLAAFAK
jgi:uncharacterized membrane protein